MGCNFYSFQRPSESKKKRADKKKLVAATIKLQMFDGEKQVRKNSKNIDLL